MPTWLILQAQSHIIYGIDHVACLYNLQVENDAVNGLPPGPFCQQLAVEDYCPQSVGQNSGRHEIHYIN